MLAKYLFIDRDGTLIEEPADEQVDSLAKLRWVKNVIPALLRLSAAGYRFVMVTNQDGLGSEGYPRAAFDEVQKTVMDLLESQGIIFEEILVCPHFAKDGCACRKPALGLLTGFLQRSDWDRKRSFVIGDRVTDLDLASNMGIEGIRLGEVGWGEIADRLIEAPRSATVHRKTKETDIEVAVNLDGPGKAEISTGIGYFDHMLEQLSKHGGFDLRVRAKGDLHIDEHHTVEDTALALGEALKQALGDKIGIARYGFLLPMDEAEAKVSLDLGGRAYFVFEGRFSRERVGELPTELVPHFFRSLADSLAATLHIEVKGENAHHMIESMFKGMGRSLRLAAARTGKNELPSTKGTL